MREFFLINVFLCCHHLCRVVIFLVVNEQTSRTKNAEKWTKEIRRVYIKFINGNRQLYEIVSNGFFFVSLCVYAHYAVMTTVGTCKVYTGCRHNKIFYVEWKKKWSHRREKCIHTSIYIIIFGKLKKKGSHTRLTNGKSFRNERRKLMQGKKHRVGRELVRLQ